MSSRFDVATTKDEGISRMLSKRNVLDSCCTTHIHRYIRVVHTETRNGCIEYRWLQGCACVCAAQGERPEVTASRTSLIRGSLTPSETRARRLSARRLPVRSFLLFHAQILFQISFSRHPCVAPISNFYCSMSFSRNPQKRDLLPSHGYPSRLTSSPRFRILNVCEIVQSHQH